jgi:hypothetical protein
MAGSSSVPPNATTEIPTSLGNIDFIDLLRTNLCSTASANKCLESFGSVRVNALYAP